MFSNITNITILLLTILLLLTTFMGQQVPNQTEISQVAR